MTAEHRSLLKFRPNNSLGRVCWSLEVLRRRGQLPCLGAKLRWLYWRHVRRYDCEVCHRCGRPVGPFTGSWWHTRDTLWVQGGGVHYGVLCPPCFTTEAGAAGFRIRWIAEVDAT